MHTCFVAFTIVRYMCKRHYGRGPVVHYPCHLATVHVWNFPAKPYRYEAPYSNNGPAVHLDGFLLLKQNPVRSPQLFDIYKMYTETAQRITKFDSVIQWDRIRNKFKTQYMPNTKLSFVFRCAVQVFRFKS